jgi:TatD DNase family protein
LKQGTMLIMRFVDTHCHVHFADYEHDADVVLAKAAHNGVTKVICVGCTLHDSQAGVEFARTREGVWASIGLHPHEGSVYVDDHHALQQFRELVNKPKVIAIGETGLDYYYEHSSREIQQKLLRFQLDLAVEHDLPLIFHVRDAFEDFWRIFDEYKGLRGVVHSFTATEKELNDILSRGLYVGFNGILTFTKKQEQLGAAKKAPIERILVETDAPFLTPVPFRGKLCEPGHVIVTAEFLSYIRGENLELLSAATTQNAERLFNI